MSSEAEESPSSRCPVCEEATAEERRTVCVKCEVWCCDDGECVTEHKFTFHATHGFPADRVLCDDCIEQLVLAQKR